MSRKYYNDVFDLIDGIFSDAFNSSIDVIQPARFNKQISSAAFPPANVVVNTKTKDLTIQVALAGVKEDELNLSFDGDYLHLIVDRATGDKNLKDGEEAIEYVIQRGLKTVDHAEVSWVIDPRYYDRDSANIKFEDGLLTIKVSPRSEVAPKKIKLFGKLAEKTAIAE
jgi:HSP20 family molecular chaperone IbpA